MSELGAPANRSGGGAASTGPQLGMPQVLEFLWFDNLNPNPNPNLNPDLTLP